jgi:hypothetical protein
LKRKGCHWTRDVDAKPICSPGAQITLHSSQLQSHCPTTAIETPEHQHSWQQCSQSPSSGNNSGAYN